MRAAGPWGGEGSSYGTRHFGRKEETPSFPPPPLSTSRACAPKLQRWYFHLPGHLCNSWWRCRPTTWSPDPGLEGLGLQGVFTVLPLRLACHPFIRQMLAESTFCAGNIGGWRLGQDQLPPEVYPSPSPATPERRSCRKPGMSGSWPRQPPRGLRAAGPASGPALKRPPFNQVLEPVIWAWLSPLFFYRRQYTFYLRVRVRGREGVCICVSAGEGHVCVVLVSQY